MVLKALKSELALPSHTFATLLVCTPYLDCICVTQPAAGMRSESSMAGMRQIVITCGYVSCAKAVTRKYGRKVG